jgi:hypothetical protein
MNVDDKCGDHILQVVARQVQIQAHKQIAQAVAKCSEAVFEEDPYQFAIKQV